MTDLTGYQWRAVGPEHPNAGELVPVDDWRFHEHGPGCPCGPHVDLTPAGPSSPHAVTETWTHRRTALPDTIEEMNA